jgi:hypothetical protein
MYGVLLWEILTFAREQPFENLTDEKVIENIGHVYQDSKKHVSYSIASDQYSIRALSNICKILNFNDRIGKLRGKIFN